MKRRTFLQASAALLAGATGCSSPPPPGATPGPARPTAATTSTPTPSDTASPVGEEFILHSSRPLDLETPVEKLGEYLTPNPSFFIRTHHPEPRVDPASYKLSLDGLVNHPLQLDLAALQDMPQEGVTAVLQCSGNGRVYYRPRVPGVAWERGAVGNAEWSGVRLKTLLDKAGLKPGARWVVLQSADKPVMQSTPPFVRAIPIEKAMQPDTLLALKMNHQPLPLMHGFPVRAVVPGWVGDDWVKWLVSLRVTEREPEDFFYATAYRYPSVAVEPGAKVPPEKMRPMTEMVVKSLVVNPRSGAQVKAGSKLQVDGVAWTGGARRIKGVEVKVGATRLQAELLGEDRPYAWRQWRVEWAPPGAGSYVLRCRATDDAGQTQPEEPSPWNPGGYLWNSCDQVSVMVLS